jgi:hypothetical protein
LDADDWWRKDKLTLTLRALESHGTAVLAFSGYRQVFVDGTQLPDCSYEKAPSFDDMFTHRFDMPPSVVLMRRSTFERCGGFCEEFGGAGFEDTYLWLLAREQGEFSYVDDLLMSRQAKASYCHKGWFVNGKKFERLVFARYGQRALPIIRQNEKDLADMALQEASVQHRLGNSTVALRWWIQAARLRPREAFWRAVAAILRAGARLYRRGHAAHASIS